jgi:hypothetical protein
LAADLDRCCRLIPGRASHWRDLLVAFPTHGVVNRDVTCIADMVTSSLHVSTSEHTHPSHYEKLLFGQWVSQWANPLAEANSIGVV